MIRAGIVNVERLMNPDRYRKYYQTVPVWRQEKADRLRKQEDKALSIGAWTLYQMMREEYGVSEQVVFNLSHSGKYALCALDDRETADHKVGCDIEQIAQAHHKLAERFFTAEEYDYITAFPGEAEQTQAFYRLWVLKESFVKATREGMGLGFRNFTVSFDAEELPVLAEYPAGITDTYYFKEYQYEAAAGKIAVCSTEPVFAEQIISKNL